MSRGVTRHKKPRKEATDMAKVNQRLWKVPGQRAKRKAWGFTVMEDGKQKRHYRAEWTKDDADTELAKVLLGIEQPKPPAGGLTFSAAVDRYIAAKARKKSVGEQQRVLESFKTYFGGETSLAEITAARISEWKGQRLGTKSRQTGEVLSLASVNRPLSVLRALLRTARDEWDVLPDVPRIKLERGERARLRWITPEEAQGLLGECQASRNKDLADLVEFALFTGLRQAEMLGLDWQRTDRSRGVILARETKNGKDREIPLNERADAVLLRRGPRESGLVFGARSFDHFRTAWEHAVERAKIVDFHFHDLRRTFASWAVQRGVTLPELKDLLGHSSLAMVLIYAHLGPQHLRSAISRLDGVFSPPSEPAPGSANGSAGGLVAGRDVAGSAQDSAQESLEAAEVSRK
jgi:integrase